MAIRVFVGCSVGDDLESQAVLDYTLRKHASEPVEVIWMQLSRDPASPFYSDGSKGWQTRNWSTPFSGFRWAVPALCGFEGKALYTDSDVIFRADIAELWNQPFKPGKVVLAKGGTESWRFCVSLWNCAAAQPYLPSKAELHKPDAHQSLIGRFRNSNLVQPFVGNWNCVDGERYDSLDDPDIRLLHYSDESAQPHLKRAIPRLAREGRKHWFDGKVRAHWRKDLIELFERTLEEAIAAGYAPENYAPAVRFGAYNIAKHTGYSGHRWTQ